MKKTKKFYFIFFAFILFILFLSPISGDDWGNYLVGQNGIRHMIGQALGMYLSWEGRLGSRLLINFLTYNKIIWNFVNTFVIVGITYFINNICKFKNKVSLLLLTFLIFLFMNLFTFSQTIVWIAGNITYLFVIVLLLIYIKMLLNNNYNKINITLLIFLNIIIPTFIEHMALILIFINTIFSISYFCRYKKFNKLLLIFLIISIASFLTMFLSPGNRYRSSMENIQFNELSLFGKIKYNLPSFVYYTYIVNYYSVFLMVLANILIIKKTFKKLFIKLGLYFFQVIAIIPVINYILDTTISKSFIDYNSILVICYYLLFTIISFILIIRIKDIRKSYLPLLFFTIGILSNTVMLLSPTWGYRTSLGTYIFLCISSLCVIDYYMKENKVYIIGLISINCIGALFYSIFYVNIRNAYNDNYKLIKEGIENNSDVIEIYSYPGFAPCNINPSNEYHLEEYKKYYGMKDNVEIRFIEDKWNFIFYKRK